MSAILTSMAGGSSAIARFLGVRPHEWGLLAATASYLLSLFAVHILLGTLLTALFLDRFDRTWLPYVYVAQATFTIALSSVYSGLLGRVRRSLETLGAMLILAAMLVAARSLLPILSDWFVFVLSVVATGYSSVLIIQASSVLNDCFDARQGKRLLPLAGAGGSIGAGIGGLIAGVLAERVGTVNLLYVAALLVGVLIASASWVLRRYATTDSETSPYQRFLDAPQPGMWSDFAAGITSLRGDRLLFYLALAALTANAASTLVKYQLEVALQDQFERDEIARFLGVFSLVSNLGVLGVQLFAESRLIRRYGLIVALLLSPLALTAGSAIACVIPAFVVIATTRLFDVVTRYSLSGTGTELAFIPLPSAAKRRAKVTIKGILLPASTLVVSALLVGMAYAPAVAPSVAALVLGAVAIVACLRIKVPYRERLEEVLERRTLRIDARERGLEMTDPESRAVLARVLSSRDEPLVFLSLELVSNGDVPFEIGAIESLLHHSSPRVRAEATRAIGRYGGPEQRAAIIRVLREDPSPDVRCVCLRALVDLGGEVDCEELEWVTADSSLDVRAEAIVLFFSAGGIDGIVRGADRLRPLLASRDTKELCAAAWAVGRIGVRYFRRSIVVLLEHSEFRVRRAALAAAQQTPDPQIAKHVVALLADVQLARFARRALRAYDWRDVLPLLQDAAAAEQASVALRIQIVKTMADHPAAETLDDLVTWARDPEEPVRYQAFKSMRRIHGAESSRSMHVVLLDFVQQLIDEGCRRLLAIETLERKAVQNPRLLLVRDELSNRRHRGLKSLFRILEMYCGSPDVYRAYLNYASEDPRLVATSLEVLGLSLDSKLGGEVLLYLDNAPLAEKVSWARQRLGDEAEAEWRVLLRREGEWFEGLVRWSDAHALEETMLSTIERIYFFKTVDLFSRLSAAQLEPLTRITEEVNVPANRVVFEEGTAGDVFYLILSGRVVVERKHKKLVELEAKDCFGEMAILDNAPRSATVRTLTECDFLVIRRDEFNDLIDEYPDIARGILQKLSQRLRKALEDYEASKSIPPGRS